MTGENLWRLQKFLAHAGICSRRHAEKLILQGRIEVDGKTVRKLGTKIDPGCQKVKLDGKLITLKKDYKYYILNKPPGFLTTLHDPYGRPSIKKFLANVDERVYPVGRLDKDSQGLLLLTNHGELSYRLLHPKFKVPKTYVVTVEGMPSNILIESFKKGIEIEKGTVARAKSIKYLSSDDKNSTYEIVLTEGRKRQIRYMFKVLGHRVLKLVRVKMGPLSLGNLKQGRIRSLDKNEIRQLLGAVNL